MRRDLDIFYLLIPHQNSIQRRTSTRFREANDRRDIRAHDSYESLFIGSDSIPGGVLFLVYYADDEDFKI